MTPRRPLEPESDTNMGEDGGSRSFGSALDGIDFEPLGRRSVRTRDAGTQNTNPSRNPLPRSVRYDHALGVLVIDFMNGSTFTTPISAFADLAGANVDEIADVELLGDTLLHWTSRKTSHDIAAVLAGDFRPKASWKGSFAEHSVGITETGSAPPRWCDPVIKFLSNNLPGDSNVRWYHHFLTSYQIGCETLVALGQAEATEDGAIPLTGPSLPAILPRQDDVAVAILYLAGQSGLITFLSNDDDKATQAVGEGFDSLHHFGNRSWAARSHPDVTNILRLIGVVDGFEWTEAAETILWRESPQEWPIDFTDHPRFLDALDEACARMPDHIREAVERFSQVTEKDIAIYTATSHQSGENSNAVIRLQPQTREQAISTVLWIRRFDFDELFYKFWRIEDGWLGPDEAARALEIFSDPLAIAMRRAVAARLYPHLPHLAE